MDNNKKDIDTVWTQIQPIVIDELKQIFPGEEELIRNIPAMAELAKRVQLTTDRTALELAFGFLREAERDMESCKVLYSKKIFPHAVYHLQQAVEKATKGYVLGFGLLSPKEIREIGHDTPMLLLKAVIDKTGLKAWADQSEDNALRQLIDDSYKAISEETKRQEIARTSYSSINENLSKINWYHNVTRQLCQNLLARVTSSISADLPLSPLLQSVSTLPTLFILAAISFPHEAYTRYPDSDITPSEYLANLGIVRSIPNMLKYLKPEIQELKKVLLPHSG